MVSDGLCRRGERERYPGGVRSDAVRGRGARVYRVDGARLGLLAQQQEVTQGEIPKEILVGRGEAFFNAKLSPVRFDPSGILRAHTSFCSNPCGVLQARDRVLTRFNGSGSLVDCCVRYKGRPLKWAKTVRRKLRSLAYRFPLSRGPLE